MLRLVPLFPFWLVNLVPAFLGVSLPTFTLASDLGMIPAAFVYASVGSGLNAMLDRGGQPDLGLVLEPQGPPATAGPGGPGAAAGGLSPLAAAVRSRPPRGRRGFGLGRLAHAQELVAPAALQLRAGQVQQRAELLLDRVADAAMVVGPAAMRAAHGLGDDLVDQPMPEQVLGRQLQGLGRDRRLVAAAPQDRGAALGRDHRVDRVLEHQDTVGGRQGDRPARAALADDGGDDGHLQRQADLDGARDGLGLAALLGVDAGMGARAYRRR